MDYSSLSPITHSDAHRVGIVTLVLTLVLGGCGYRPVHETPLADFIWQTDQVGSSGYLFEIGDIVTVKFYYNPELDYDVPVRSDGNISLALIGDVPAAGHSTRELSETVSASYKTFLNHPNATAILRSPAGHRVFVTGEVNAPGAFTIQGSETTLSALSMAGGLGDRGTFKRVVLIRRLPRHPVPMVAVLNLNKALDGSDPLQDVKVYLNDIIYVPRTGAAESNVVLKNLIWGKAPVAGYASAVWSGTIK